MKAYIFLLAVGLFAHPAAAQPVRDCDGFEANAGNANGAIRLIALGMGPGVTMPVNQQNGAVTAR